jgi:hypothetical protein
MIETAQPNSLSELHRQLRTLWWKRTLVRIAAVGSRSALAILGGLLAVFALDLLFDMDRLQRAVAMMLALAGVVWSLRRFVWTFILRREDRTDLALLVERANRIDNDFVAALQFANPESLGNGSDQLRGAVIQQAAEQSHQVEFSLTESDRNLWQRSGVLVVAIGVLAGVVSVNVDYAHVFGQRLMFRLVDYPTSTVVERIVINHETVLARGPDRNAPRELSVAQDLAVDFWLLASGTVPTAGQIRIDSLSTGHSRTIEVKPVTRQVRLERLNVGRRAVQKALSDQEVSSSHWSKATRALLELDAGDAARELVDLGALSTDRLRSVLERIDRARQRLEVGNTAVVAFHGRLERLTSSVSYRARLGDSQTKNARLTMLPLPIVELTGEITPPVYTRSERQRVRPGTLQFSVLEGSAVAFELHAHNKPLASAWAVVEHNGREVRGEFRSQGIDKSQWSCGAVALGLTQINDEVRFWIEVVDQDGLGLSAPLQGAIRVQRDAPPVATLSANHRVVVPTANPMLDYRVSDDYAIAAIRLHAQIKPPAVAGDGLKERAPANHDRAVRFDLPLPGGADAITELPFHGRVPVDMSALAPRSGETLRVVLEVVDGRGDSQGVSFETQPVLLEVADESRVLASIAESDEQTERRLTEIIQRQLEVRSSP